METKVVHIARCPEHGLHGQRTTCHVCGGPVEQVPVIVMQPSARGPCECGCGRPKRGSGDYFEDACRTRHWKERTEYVHPDSALARNARNASEPVRPRRPGGVQISMGPAVAAVAAYLASATPLSPAESERVARMVLRRALPSKQRKRVESRSAML